MTKVKTILLKFAGPLQSWGSSSHFENRHTDFYPTKSAIIGIISASFGYRRDNDEEIKKLNKIKFAVRIDQRGNLLRDYHIARKFKNGIFERTYVTNRYYLEDAVFVVAISHEDDDFVDLIEEKLKNPFFQYYMGRRSLPLSADFIISKTENSVIESLKQCDWQAAKWYKKKNNRELIELEIHADSNLLDNSIYSLKKDKVISFSQKERKFAFRYESESIIKITNKMYKDIETSHDVFGSIGD